MANWTEQLGQSSFHFSISCCLIKHQCPLDSTQSSIWLGRIKGALLSRKSSWQAGALRLIKLKPRVGRHRPLLAAESPGVKPCSMLLFPAPSRPSTRTWRFPRSSSSCRQTAELLMFANAWKCWVEPKIKHITYSTQSEGVWWAWRSLWFLNICVALWAYQTTSSSSKYRKYMHSDGPGWRASDIKENITTKYHLQEWTSVVLVEKLCKVNSQNMVEGCFSGLSYKPGISFQVCSGPSDVNFVVRQWVSAVRMSICPPVFTTGNGCVPGNRLQPDLKKFNDNKYSSCPSLWQTVIKALLFIFSCTGRYKCRYIQTAERINWSGSTFKHHNELLFNKDGCFCRALTSNICLLFGSIGLHLISHSL